MTKAELIVRALGLAASPNIDMEDIDSEQLAFADKIREKYSSYKRQMDLTSSSRKACIEVVQEILDLP